MGLVQLTESQLVMLTEAQLVALYETAGTLNLVVGGQVLSIFTAS